MIPTTSTVMFCISQLSWKPDVPPGEAETEVIWILEVVGTLPGNDRHLVAIWGFPKIRLASVILHVIYF